MTDCMVYPQTTNFANMISNINQELRTKGHVGSSEDNRASSEAPTSPRSTRSLTENTLRHITTEMRAQNYDVIRFATYRAACKLRFIQKKTNLHLVDLWNVIEAFRECGLTPIEAEQEVPVSRLESLLTTVYAQLNKRLPTNAQIAADQSAHTLYSWLLHAYDPLGRGQVRVLSIKVALTTMCSGKHMDKLRYAFTQMCDGEGVMVVKKFQDYIKEVLALPTAVYEGPSFGYNDTAARACFDGKSKVTVNDFLDTLMSDPGPQCLMWWPILQRMANVENVFHPLQCDSCHVESFVGFRYKCQRCYNYHLCQDCFWRGRTSGNHSNDHEVKEYSTYKSPAKQLSHSLKKSFRCVPNKQSNHIPKFPDQPEKTLDLTHIVPPTPPPMHNGFHDSSCLLSQRSLDASSMDSSSATKSAKSQQYRAHNVTTATTETHFKTTVTMETNNNNILKTTEQPQEIPDSSDAKRKQKGHIDKLLEEMEKLESDRTSSSEQEPDVVDDMIKKEKVSETFHAVQTQVSDASSTSTYPEVFLPPESPLDVRSLPFPKLSQSVDSPLPRSTMSSFKPSSSNSRPESLELPPPPTPQELQGLDSSDPSGKLPEPSSSPVSPGAFSYTQGMFPNVMGSPKIHRGHKGHSPSEEGVPKMGVLPQLSTMLSAAPDSPPQHRDEEQHPPKSSSLERRIAMGTGAIPKRVVTPPTPPKRGRSSSPKTGSRLHPECIVTPGSNSPRIPRKMSNGSKESPPPVPSRSASLLVTMVKSQTTMETVHKTTELVSKATENSTDLVPKGTEKPFASKATEKSTETVSKAKAESTIFAVTMTTGSSPSSPSRLNSSLDSGRIDDEHRLIARYAARLAADANNAARSPTELNYNIDASKAQHELIKQLESKNREILHEIQRLRQEQEQQAKFGSEHRHTSNPTLLAELRLLRQRRDELEARMQALQDSRRELMVQLEGLMKLLKVGQAAHSPRSTPTSSPRSRSAQSPPITLTRAHSTPTTPGTAAGDSLMGVGGDVRQAFGAAAGSSGSVKSLRNDLLVAADSVTNAMSSLVKELNSEASGSDDDDLDEECNKKYSKQSELDEFLVLQEEMHQRLRQESDFLRELQARKSRSSSRAGSDTEHDNFVGDGYSREHSSDDLLVTDDAESYVRTDDDMRTDDDDLYEHDHKPVRRNVLHPHRYTTDDESCLETDQESYIRTDDEEGGNTEWEESMRRWVNR